MDGKFDRTARRITLGVHAFLFCALFSGLALASETKRAGAIVALEEIQGTWDANLEVWQGHARGRALDEASNSLRIGQRTPLRYSLDRPAYLLLLQLDAYGAMTVFQSSKVEPTSEARISDTLGVELKAAPPTGPQDLFIVATPEPIPSDWLAGAEAASEVEYLDASRSVDVASTLRSKLMGADAFPASVGRIRSVIRGRPGTRGLGSLGTESGQSQAMGGGYSERDIVDYFTSKKTRSISRTRLPTQVWFPRDSATLTVDSKRDLDTVARALTDSRLSDMHFVVSGHTCDLADDDYNKALSGRRARSVMEYLMSRGVGEVRLGIDAMGESEPVQPNDGEENRKWNRRVEIELRRTPATERSS